MGGLIKLGIKYEGLAKGKRQFAEVQMVNSEVGEGIGRELSCH